jgi:CheY-like chemotaxis protein
MENMDTGILTVSLSVVDNTGNLSKRIPSSEQSSYFELKVSDTGEGIDPADSRKIFDPYYTTRPQGVGSGLGLATTMGIVRQYGGQIIVDSRPGSGATFMVYLPVFQEQSDSAGQQQDITAKKPAGGHGRILFVDDEEEILAIGERMFKNLGYAVKTAHSGKEAFDLFSRKPEQFDILVTDMAMPGMTGLMLAKQIFKIRPGFPVVMCTGYSDNIDQDTAMELGIKAYVAKPYELTDLAEAVSSHLQNKENKSIAPALP